MRRPSILERDEQADDLETAADEMKALAAEIRHAPVSVAELRAELGDDAPGLLRGIDRDVYTDDLGRKVITRELARQILEQRNQRDAQRAAAHERFTTEARAVGEARERERQAMLASVDARQARYGGGIGGDDYATAAEVVLGPADEEKQAKSDERWADFATRTVVTYDSDGRVIGGP